MNLPKPGESLFGQRKNKLVFDCKASSPPEQRDLHSEAHQQRRQQHPAAARGGRDVFNDDGFASRAPSPEVDSQQAGRSSPSCIDDRLVALLQGSYQVISSSGKRNSAAVENQEATPKSTRSTNLEAQVSKAAAAKEEFHAQGKSSGELQAEIAKVGAASCDQGCKLRVCNSEAEAKRLAEVEALRSKLQNAEQANVVLTQEVGSLQQCQQLCVKARKQAIEELDGARDELAVLKGVRSSLQCALDRANEATNQVRDEYRACQQQEEARREADRRLLEREFERERRQLEATAAEAQCLICFDAPKQYAVMPCGHLCFCASCKQDKGSCPVCRQEIVALQRIYQ